MTTEFVTVPGARLACTVRGDGPVVLYAHGLLDSRVVERQMGRWDFSPVALAGCRLVAFDARGHGESSGDPEPEAYRWPALAEDLLALADHFSRDTPVSVIGLSMGTGTTLHAVLKRPARFHRLVLCAPPTAWDTRPAQAQLYRKLATVASRGNAALLERAAAVAPVAPIFASAPRHPLLAAVPLALMAHVLAGAAASDLPAPDALRSVSQPTLILSWDTDAAHPRSTAERLAALLPNAQLHMAENLTQIATWGAQAAAFLSSP